MSGTTLLILHDFVGFKEELHICVKLTNIRIAKNRKKHTYLIETIRKKVSEMENQDWKIEFTRIKAHAGHHGNELADQTAKEAATNSDIECYKRIPQE